MPALVRAAGYPSTRQLTAWQSAGSLILAKCARNARVHHVGSLTDDAGLAFTLVTRRYVRQREPFGQPLVRVPAVASSLAIMRVHLLQAQAALARAVDCWQTPAAARCAHAPAVARVTAATTATEVARLAHQLHGAMGISQEYPLHRLTRRLWAWRDAETPEHEWALISGAAVIAEGEPTL